MNAQAHCTVPSSNSLQLPPNPINFHLPFAADLQWRCRRDFMLSEDPAPVRCFSRFGIALSLRQCSPLWATAVYREHAEGCLRSWPNAPVHVDLQGDICDEAKKTKLTCLKVLAFGHGKYVEPSRMRDKGDYPKKLCLRR